ncbi:DUF4349 domain-containing protein [Sediminibacillus dalangtanensis]|uniref:DUF4349 domain-containing protein n=1 Tax=Sediminibacillus dalangtanensis TaxID=2729421 RepID=A0ABX7VR54_9BACI|nr:DUF4349 domain-containing protein [Sediminibacillus dalangtanensis]QTM98055.1 DUF4349 domain-containing protein [Sediminibacillus dalangtanensis]
MKKRYFHLFSVCLFLLLAACSNDSKESADMPMEMDSAETESSQDNAALSDKMAEENGEEGAQQEEEKAVEKASQANRKVIYHANLRIEVKDYQQTLENIQSQVTEAGGYVVESSTYQNPEDDRTEGHITARIPQEQFQPFIDFVKEGSSKVLENNVSGQDVTEEYVDLQSRLKSKQAVEKRLMAFMEEAEKTEDLLKISEDLAGVQEEIETITGRINYLENKTDLATVDINLQENDVRISGSSGESTTWQKTKEQFVKSIDLLLSFFSGLIVFLFGNLPILLLLGVLVFLGIFIARKAVQKTKQRDKTEN